ncbi:hypothetical protein [Dyadobacter tibetensis]|uniref:hypothetical protein n=1 Tax=Dyadobacter tibetensis TaxID=1211851 RepID=UPI000471024B|nr:hypothetical protein [Dyadobacter tibetensis]
MYKSKFQQSENVPIPEYAEESVSRGQTKLGFLQADGQRFCYQTIEQTYQWKNIMDELQMGWNVL